MFKSASPQRAGGRPPAVSGVPPRLGAWPAASSIGAHVEQTDPVAEATGARDHAGAVLPRRSRRATRVPRSATPVVPTGCRADAEKAGVDLYVHAPYIVNVATTNNRIRIPSRKLLQQHMDAAASIGAKGLIVHGGHVNKDDDPATGLRQLAQGDRGHRHQDPAADREHRRRRQRDDPPPRPDRRGLGRDLRGRGLRGRRLLPRHLPRLGRRHRAVHGGREGARDHRSDRPGARQRQPRRLRLRCRPARQLRRRPARRRRLRGASSATPEPRWSARPRAVPRSTGPTSRGCASTASDAQPSRPAGHGGGCARRRLRQ